MKKLIFIPVLLFSVLTWSQDKITGVEWWINGEYDDAVFQSLDHVDIFDGIVPVDLNSYPNGKHTLFFRFQNSTGKWSPVITRNFTKTPFGSDVPLITSVQFWTDNPNDEIVTHAIDPPSFLYDGVVPLSMAQHDVGRSSVYFRFKDSSGNWSQPVGYRIAKTPLGDDKVYIAAMEYWFNNDIENSTWHLFDDKPVEIDASLPLSLSALNVGTHLVEIRFYNNLGNISSVHRSLVKKLPEGLENNVIRAYRYWFNNDPLTIVQENFLQESSLQEGGIILSLNSFDPGDTVLVNMQFLDRLDQWSAIHTESVIVYDPTSIENRNMDPFKLTLYPNPVREGAEVFVEWQPTFSPDRLLITDSEGRIVMQQAIESPETGFLQLNTQSLGRGVYALTTMHGEYRVTKRLVVL